MNIQSGSFLDDWWHRRLAISLGLGALFLLVYGTGQFTAALRGHVPSFYFSWEPAIPFVPAAVVPYLSIDLFFLSAPFVIQSDRQLRTAALRVAAAIVIAGAFFVLMPLQCGFARAQVAGPLRVVFEWFWKADQPTNELPSLHVALLLIVGEIFIRRFRGWVRGLLLGWFVLIGISPLLVHQHQIADLLAGAALGMICLTVICEGGRPQSERNVRVASCYSAGAATMILLCVLLGKTGWPLWWPASSLSLVAAGYWFLGPGIYGKSNGTLGLCARLLLWPTLIGQHASLWWYSRRARPIDVVTGNLWIGRMLSNRQAAEAVAAGVTAVIDLTCEFTEPAAFRSVDYLNLPTMDLTAPTPCQIQRAIEFIRMHEPSIVCVHCKAGYSRTAVIAAAYLLANRMAKTADDAVEQLRKARPTLIVRPEARRAIERFAHASIVSVREPACVTVDSDPIGPRLI